LLDGFGRPLPCDAPFLAGLPADLLAGFATGFFALAFTTFFAVFLTAALAFVALAFLRAAIINLREFQIVSRLLSGMTLRVISS
jgi:hypothetical protein